MKVDKEDFVIMSEIISQRFGLNLETSKKVVKEILEYINLVIEGDKNENYKI